MANIDKIEKKIVSAGNTDDSNGIDITQALYDLMSIKEGELKDLFDNLDTVLVHNGKYWLHSSKSNYTSASYKFDKYVHEKVHEAVKKMNPKTSVLSGKTLRDIVLVHKANKYIFKLDVKKYYESINFADIKEDLVRSGFETELIERICRFYFTDNMSLRRGLRASPVMSEFIGLRIDNIVAQIIHESGHKPAYSRYYDDVLISFSDIDVLKKIEKILVKKLLVLGLSINEKKTRIQSTHTSNVLGLRMHNGSLIVPKRFIKILRSRIYQLDKYLYTVGYSEDSEELYAAKVMIGSVIGSIWYIINNSDTDTSKYSALLEGYYELLQEYSARLNRSLEMNIDDVFVD